MIDVKLKNDIIDLVDYGVDVELIAEELKVSTSEVKAFVKKYRNEPASKNRKTSNKAKTDESKLDIMRRKYSEALNAKSLTEIRPEPRILTTENKRYLDDTVERFHEISQELHDLSDQEKYNRFKEVYKAIEKIKDLPMTVQQAQDILELLNMFKTECPSILKYENPRIHLRTANSQIRKSLCESINDRVYETDSLEDLKKYSSILSKYISYNDLQATGVRYRIDKKQSDIQREASLRRFRTEIPEEVIRIIRDVANGELDVEEAKKTIKRVASEKYNKNPKTSFSLTPKQLENQMHMQIRTLLVERFDEFKVKEPSKSIEQLSALTDNFDYLMSVRTVVVNLYSNGRVDEARQIVSELQKKNSENMDYRNMEKDISRFEIGRMVCTMMNSSNSKEEEDAFISILTRKIQSSRVSLGSIPIGKSRNGSKKITLKDIWYEDPVIQK